jgi:hypothetical protein
MQRTLIFGSTVICAVALTVGVHAAPRAQATKASDGKTMTMTGCLEKGDEANTFKLTHVADDAGAGTKTAEAMKPNWELIGAPASLKLSEHVGHKVTVTGSKAGAEESAKMEGKTGSASTAKEATERHLKVTELKHVAATCP